MLGSGLVMAVDAGALKTFSQSSDGRGCRAIEDLQSV